MVTVILLRHAHSSDNGRILSGRQPGVGLDDQGQREAERVRVALTLLRPRAIHSSPLARAQATVRPLARALGLPIVIEPALTEIDFGAWSSRGFDDLAADTGWRRFNATPAEDVVPGSERFADVAARATATLRRLASTTRRGPIVAVSHGDVIRLALTDLLSLPLSAFRQFTIEPASACAITFTVRSVVVDLDVLGCDQPKRVIGYAQEEHARRCHHLASSG